MTNTLRLIGMVVALAAVALAAALVHPQWARDLGVEGGLTAWLPRSGDGKSAEFKAYTGGLERRARAKQRVARQLLDGRITLFEAAALFRVLNEEYPRMTRYPGPP